MKKSLIHAPSRALAAFSIGLLLWPVPSTPSSALSEEKMAPEELVARHLDSIGSPAARASVRSFRATGTSKATFRPRGTNSVEGRAVIASEGDKLMIAMAFEALHYPHEKVGFDGKTVTVGAIAPGRRSVLGDFLLAHDTILKHGVLGGTLTTAWTLLNLRDRAPKLEYGGQKKIGDRLVETLRLIPRGGSDLRITLFFDAQNYQHVRSEFRRIVQAQMGGSPEQSAGQRETRYTLVEEFSGFAKEGRLTLPHSYKLALVVDAPSGSLSSEWVMDLGKFLFNEPFPPESFNMSGERRL